MSIKVIKAETPTGAELKTDEGQAYILSMLLLKRMIEEGRNNALGKMAKEHILFTPIDNETYNFIAEILEETPNMARWISLYALEE